MTVPEHRAKPKPKAKHVKPKPKPISSDWSNELQSDRVCSDQGCEGAVGT